MKLTALHIKLLVMLAFLAGKPGVAQPSLHSSVTIAGERVFKDIKKNNIYYYTPVDYKLATDQAGKPVFTLTQMRYTGTRAGGDQDTSRSSNFLQFKVMTDETQQSRITALRNAMRTSHPSAELRMLPIKKFFSVLVFAPADNSGSVPDSVNLVKSDVADASDGNDAANNSYWTERTVALRLSDIDAQLVEKALQDQQTLISFTYAIYTDFAEKTFEELNTGISGKLHKGIFTHFKKQLNLPNDTLTKTVLVKAESIPLSVDIKKWPTLIQKIDINERVPARYALFDVYCYDFNNELRPDLFEKKIEIKAASVAGKEISTTYAFKQNRPDVYARAIRFPYAIKFDRPFYYKVTEINHEGEISSTDWIQKKDWGGILDITSPPDKIVIKPKESDQ